MLYTKNNENTWRWYGDYEGNISKSTCKNKSWA